MIYHDKEVQELKDLKEEVEKAIEDNLKMIYNAYKEIEILQKDIAEYKKTFKKESK